MLPRLADHSATGGQMLSAISAGTPGSTGSLCFPNLKITCFVEIQSDTRASWKDFVREEALKSEGD
jgi:hypothetical protein